jgi:hypothetical protein
VDALGEGDQAVRRFAVTSISTFISGFRRAATTRMVAAGLDIRRRDIGTSIQVSRGPPAFPGRRSLSLSQDERYVTLGPDGERSSSAREYVHDDHDDQHDQQDGCDGSGT